MSTSTHITTSGGLISAAFIENVREVGSRQRGVEPASFGLPWSEAPKHPAALEETIATAWELLLERWDAVRNDLAVMDVSQVRSRWLLPLFELLDFDPVYLRGDTVLDEAGKLRFSLSHRGWEGEGAPILHTVIPSQDLDGRVTAGRGASTGSARSARSPHDVLQAFLNASPTDHWAVLSNGILLRLLRKYHHTFTRGYVQFDLESIFETRNYGDFRALYRMCHASRFASQGEGEEALPPLEQFYKDSIATGVRIGEDLRGQVRQAIETLGNGFLDGGAQEDPVPLHRRLQQDETLCKQYYGEILHVIYRILFLLFAEQRGMMPGRNSLYAEAYSIGALRARAEGDIPLEDDFTDLWHGLQVTFRMVREGVEDLGVFGYDGMLFDEDQTPLLNGRGMRNSDLLQAVRALTLIEREGVLQRISYADLGVEELGSIYESLLDFTPRVTTHAETVDASTLLSAGVREVPAHTPSTGSGLRFFLDPRGSERKTTGSYYTHPSLVNELIKSALLPVARERLAAAGLPVIEEAAIGEVTAGLLTDYTGLTDARRAAGAKALLSITVCDPAAGSGHFLVKANNALGAELARIRSGDEYPAEAEVQASKRDVLAHCIYAVDLNPMAVELCKVSLWINASVADRPLSFLDHHIKCGNSLIGAMVRPQAKRRSPQAPDLMAAGIPYEAFDPKITGNDREVADRVRAQSRQEQREFEQGGGYQMGLFRVRVYEPTGEVWEVYQYVGTLAEDQPRAARERYAVYLTTDEYRRRKLEADCWTAAFFWPLTKGMEWAPTFGEFRRLRDEGPETLPAGALDQIEALAEQYRFFHWHLEFPDVFGDDGDGGFDVVLGNPPWERIKLQEKEFFADKDAAIANARTAAERRKLIRSLSKTNPALHTAYAAALRESEATGHFLRNSGRFPLTAGGDINTYAVFAGLARGLLSPGGRAGIVVPTGIATDYTYRDFFADLVERGQLASLYDFENRAGLFSEVDSRMKFSLMTLTSDATEADFAFFLHTTDELADPERHFPLSRADLALINPNTRTVPVFRTRRDADLTRKLYRAAPLLVNEERGENPWGVRFFTMFHMTNDSHLFRTREELEAQGFALEGNRFVRGEKVYLPLYEGRMIHHFDHRAVSVGVSTETQFRSGVSIDTTPEQYADPAFAPLPRYWVEEQNVRGVVSGYARDWCFGFKDITSPTNERTFIGTIIPFAAVGNKIPLLLLPQAGILQVATFAGQCSTFVFDYLVRQKMGGVSLNFYLVEQFPVLPPDRYTPDLLAFLVPRVVELTYTAWDLQPFAADVLAEVGAETWARWFQDAPVHTSPPPSWAAALSPSQGEGRGGGPPPFVWNEERRAVLRAELDALYAHPYGLTREELDYILDTFPIVRRKDEAQYGEYRTKRMVMEAFESLRPLME